MEKGIKKRLGWVELYLKIKDAGIVCWRCSISRPMLRKWVKHYKEKGVEGLIEKSRKPNTSPKRKVDNLQEELKRAYVRSETYPK